MIVTDPLDIALASDVRQFSRAIADFERWTGWRTVCVPELQVQPELREGAVIGLYQGPQQPILLATGSGHDTAIHEMCHAADERLSWPSMENRELYPVTHIDPVTYSTRDAQVRESFARVCEAGPEGLALVRALERRCGVPLEHPGYALVLDEVYASTQPVRIPAELGTLEQEDVGIDAFVGEGTLVDVGSGGRLIWLVVRDPDPLLEAGNPTDRLTRQVWRVVGWSPESRQVEVEHTLLRRPPGLLEGARFFHLLDSVDDPILVESTSTRPLHLWQLDEQSGTLVRVAELPHSLAPESEAGRFRAGVVADGVALVRVDDPPGERTDGELGIPGDHGGADLRLAGTGWVAVELSSGALIDDHAVLRGAFDRHLQGLSLTLSATADGTLAVGLETAVVPYWPYQSRLVDSEGRVDELRVAGAGLSQPLAVDLDGRQLAVWSNSEIWHTFDNRRFQVLHTPGTRQYWVPEDACAPRDEGMAVDHVMHVAGELWLLGAVQGVRRTILRRISVPETAGR